MMKSLFLLMSSSQTAEPRQTRPNDLLPSNERVLYSPSTNSQSLIRRQGQSNRKDVACTWRHCRCSCHAVLRATKRFWFLEAPSLSSLWNACDYTSCTRRQHHAYIWIGFTPIGIPFAISASLEVLLASASFSLTTSLTIERIVKYTSPGFELLWKCGRGNLCWPEAREAFESIIRSGKATINDVDPSGRMLLEKLLEYEWCLEQGNLQLKLLELLVRMGAKTSRVQLLYNCVRWWRANSRISIIKSLVNYGLDVDDFDTLRARHLLFPIPSEIAPFVSDPFPIEITCILSERSPGFGGNTLLHEAVLLGSQDDVEKCLRKTHSITKTNFLGQSALHSAVARPQHLKKLLDAGLDVNFKDNYGQTPLTYAATRGETDAVLQLLVAGADPFENSSSWVDHAFYNGHLELITDALQYVVNSPQYDDKLVQEILDWALTSWQKRRSEAVESECLRRLLDFGADTNTRFNVHSSSGNTLLHFGFHSRSVLSVIQAGFTGINAENSEGITPLLAVARYCGPNLLEIYINHGADIHHKNQEGWNVLHVLCRRIRSCFFYLYDYQLKVEEKEFAQLQSRLDCVKLLIVKGTKTVDGDACQCRCSQTGCLPHRMLLGFYVSHSRALCVVWALEYLTMLQELRTTEEARTSLLSMLRLVRFDRLDLTHVCCRRLSSGWPYIHHPDKPLPHEDAQDIIAEEEEIIQELELQMEDLSAKSYSDLLEVCFQDLRIPALEYIRKAMQYRKEHKHIIRVGIDYQNDRYIPGDEYFWPTHIPDGIGIKMYMRWLEHCHQHSKSSHANNKAAEEWYQRRLKWSSRLSEVLEDLHLEEPFEPMYEVVEVLE